MNTTRLDTDYFGRKLALITRDLSHYTPQEMARELVRLAKAADEIEAVKEAAQPVAAIPEAERVNLSHKNHVGQGLRLAEAIAAEQRAAIPEATALSDMQLYRVGYGQGVRRAAQLMEDRDLPVMAELIRNLQSTRLPAIPEATGDLLNLLIESQSSIGGDWRQRRDAAVERARTAIPEAGQSDLCPVYRWLSKVAKAERGYTGSAAHHLMNYYEGAESVPEAGQSVPDDAARLDYVYHLAMVEPFIAPIASKEKWLESIDRGIASMSADSGAGGSND